MTEAKPAGPMMSAEDVDARLRELARVPVLLVACDYDGTLAPIIDNPDEARPLRESVAALRQLAAMPDTHVAVISGRALRDLAALSRLPEEIHLVGSHGTEFDVGFAEHLSAEQRELRDRVMEAAERHRPARPRIHHRAQARRRGLPLSQGRPRDRRGRGHRCAEGTRQVEGRPPQDRQDGGGAVGAEPQQGRCLRPA